MKVFAECTRGEDFDRNVKNVHNPIDFFTLWQAVAETNRIMLKRLEFKQPSLILQKFKDSIEFLKKNLAHGKLIFFVQFSLIQQFSVDSRRHFFLFAHVQTNNTNTIFDIAPLHDFKQLKLKIVYAVVEHKSHL